MTHMGRLTVATMMTLGLGMAVATPAAAQVDGRQFEVGVQLVNAASSEFDANDLGVSGRFVWRPGMLIGAEAEVGYFAGGLGDGAPFSAGRIEALFGATVGPRIGRFRPFGKVRTGFVQFIKPDEPLACIAIYPPPLVCTLPGARIEAYDLGGGLEWWATDARFLRVDVSDRILNYEGPVSDPQGGVRTDGFFGHDIRIAIGGGVRF